MSRLILLTLALFGVTTGYGQEYLDFRHKIFHSFDVQIDSVCQVSGLACKNCITPMMCVEVDTNQFEETDLDSCTGDNTCLNGACVNKTNPTCDGMGTVQFICPAVGMFPDPVDCRKFHVCYKSNNKLIDYPDSCDSGHAYDPLTTYCKVSMKGDCTQYPVPLCPSAGYIAALPSNPSIYYTCVRKSVQTKKFLYPVLKLCPFGKKYANNKCN